MKKCAIIYNGFCSYPSVRNQVDSLSEELSLLGVKVDLIKTDVILVALEKSGVVACLGEYDFIVYLDKDPYISHALEKCGYNLVNSAKAIEVCDDKIKTHLALSGVVPMPQTVFAPLMYQQKEGDFYLQVEKKLGYPIVVKEVFGSMGKSVYLAKDRAELCALYQNLKSRPHLYQKFIGSGGKDTRLIVIGGEVVAAMRRVNENDFRSNIEAGGHGEVITPSEKEIDIAKAAAKAIGLDYCGIDVLEGADGYYLCEVNSNAFFAGITAVTKVNVARLYAEYLFKKFYKSV